MDHAKTLQQILDNPANNLTTTSRDIIETMIISLQLDQPQVVYKNIDESKVEQQIQQFEDEPTSFGMQSASINKEGRLSIIHCGEEISLSVCNWKKLVPLVHSILPDEKGGY